MCASRLVQIEQKVPLLRLLLYYVSDILYRVEPMFSLIKLYNIFVKRTMISKICDEYTSRLLLKYSLLKINITDQQEGELSNRFSQQ